MWRAVCCAFAIFTAAVLWAGGSAAQTNRLVVELNKLEAIESGCRTFFLFRNRTDLDFSGFEMSLAILDQQGVIDRLLTVDAAPLPAGSTTLKLFEIPEIPCDNIGEILLHDIARCEAGQDAAVDCFRLIDLQSKAATALIK